MHEVTCSAEAVSEDKRMLCNHDYRLCNCMVSGDMYCLKFVSVGDRFWPCDRCPLGVYLLLQRGSYDVLSVCEG